MKGSFILFKIYEIRVYWKSENDDVRFVEAYENTLDKRRVNIYF